MNVWARLASIFGRVSSPDDPMRSSGHLPVPWIPASMRISTEEAATLSVVWACIQAISTAIASSPWNVFEVSGQKRVLKPEDPLAFRLNQRAHDEITAIAFREAMLYGALAYGNSYAEILRDNAQRVSGLVPLYPDRVQVTRDQAKRLVYVYTDWDGGQKTYTPTEIFHLRGPVSVSGLMGDSIVARAAKAAALAAAAERFSMAYLANGTIPSGVLKYPGKLQPEAKDTIRNQWNEKMTGPKRGGSVVILEGGMDYEQVSADPDKAQLGMTQAWTTEQVARYFSVPLVKLGVAAAAQGYGTNLESLNLEWTRTGLRPWALRLEQEANAKLLSAKPYRETAIDMEWLVRGDAKSQADADAIRIKSGVFSVNEVRQKIGANTIGPEGDLRFIDSAMTPLTTTLLEIQELAAKEPEPAPPPGATDEEDDSTDGADKPEGDGEEDPVLRQALRQMVLQNLQRLESKMGRERTRMEKLGHTPEEIATKFRTWMAEDCGPALELIRAAAASQGRHVNGEADVALLAAVDAVSSGKPANAAADRMLAMLLPEVNQ